MATHYAITEHPEDRVRCWLPSNYACERMSTGLTVIWGGDRPGHLLNGDVRPRLAGVGIDSRPVQHDAPEIEDWLRERNDLRKTAMAAVDDMCEQAGADWDTVGAAPPVAGIEPPQALAVINCAACEESDWITPDPETLDACAQFAREHAGCRLSEED
jgi:hypothetical protein